MEVALESYLSELRLHFNQELERALNSDPINYGDVDTFYVAAWTCAQFIVGFINRNAFCKELINLGLQNYVNNIKICFANYFTPEVYISEEASGDEEYSGFSESSNEFEN